jgi:hypothetical protein
MTRYNTDSGSWDGPSPEEMAERVRLAGPTPDEWTRFMSVRGELFAAIAASLAENGHCKSYEGALSIALPNYFEDKATSDDYGWHRADAWSITCHCYLVGPNRHYRWAGKKFSEALNKAETDLRAWIRGDFSLRHDERD